jgi:hypothetical protein
MQFVSDRLSLTGVRVPTFSNCSIVVSDYHDLDAVLPASILLSGQASGEPPLRPGTVFSCFVAHQESLFAGLWSEGPVPHMGVCVWGGGEKSGG